MIQITMGGVRLVGSGSINKAIAMQGSEMSYTNPWQIGVAGLPNGDFMRIVTVPFSGVFATGVAISGGFCEYAVIKNSSDTYATKLMTNAGDVVSNYGSGCVWYKTDNSIMLKVGMGDTATVQYVWNAFFLYEIYKYQS